MVAIAPQAPPPPAIPLEHADIDSARDTCVVGQIVRTIRIRNLVDVMNAETGLIPADAVRSIAIESVLLDTGATHLCLPVDLVEALGLRVLRHVTVETATADLLLGIHAGALVEVDGRECESEVIALPAGRQPLFGVLPMEALGMKLNMTERLVEYLPNSGIGNYIRA